CAARRRTVAQVALRVNPDVAADTHPYISTGLHKHKFGVPIGSARELYAEASEAKYLKVAGVSVHIGSRLPTLLLLARPSIVWPIWFGSCAAMAIPSTSSTSAAASALNITSPAWSFRIALRGMRGL